MSDAATSRTRSTSYLIKINGTIDGVVNQSIHIRVSRDKDNNPLELTVDIIFFDF